ncbi:FHA domain-containing protein [Glaciimonas sp. Gout2]|uniref:FHA domain-containing protein n=1 Tax=unclassified Glaciimonas TaxID=2644401 RepID=UPI002B226121|nr:MULTISPECIES: FHA domain-containing protein [unclassified Glaciimonas]MEB0012760.1 FHA domain-containing protein [Glaciimonas sp. Cout2]MEB0082238.1 FHA domain-containing protein [Glaciimonas sp. Gout2]
MAKIVLTEGDNVVQEMVLHKERTTIGRRPHNDLVIDSPAVSGEHAVIITIYNDSFLEDLSSTNGTQVNGHAVTKHFLQHNDVIQMAKYKLVYLVDAVEDISEDHHLKMFPSLRPDAIVTVIDGPGAGKKLALVKVLTTIGRPGVQVAIVARRAHGYELTHVEGNTYTRVNGAPLKVGAWSLSDGDVIDIAGMTMQFSWKPRNGYQKINTAGKR